MRAARLRLLCLFVAAWPLFGAVPAVPASPEAKEPDPPLTDEQRALNVESFEQAWETIRDKHWDPELGGLDWQAVHDEIRPRVEDASTQSEYYDAMKSMIDRFGQSHFGVIPKRVYNKIQEPSGEGPRDGATGIDVRVIDGAALVTGVPQETPGARAGVMPGWEILTIDGKDVLEGLSEIEESFRGKTMLDLIRHQVVVNRLSGKVGARKTIEFRDGSDGRVSLEIELGPPKGKKFRLGVFPSSHIWIESRRLEGDVGYIAFNGFMDPVNLMPAFEKAVKSFRDCRGIVIDIRGNGGGLPGMAMGMAGWLIDRPDQHLGTMHLRGTELRIVVNPRLEIYDGPVAVLIDGSSASCAEIFSGGLRDLGRARLFGTRTAGAVLPAHFTKLPNGDFFFYPIADYFSQGGARLEAVGVGPDVDAPHERAALLAGRDNALQKAIDWIHGQSSRHSPSKGTDQ
jgi:carboxyl-terminal processing protease